MVSSGIAAAVALVTFSATLAHGDTASDATAIAVVVGRESFVTHVSKDDLREIYLRRQRVWPNGARALPINLPPGNPGQPQ